MVKFIFPQVLSSNEPVKRVYLSLPFTELPGDGTVDHRNFSLEDLPRFSTVFASLDLSMEQVWDVPDSDVQQILGPHSIFVLLICQCVLTVTTMPVPSCVCNEQVCILPILEKSRLSRVKLCSKIICGGLHYSNGSSVCTNLFALVVCVFIHLHIYLLR